MALEDLKDWKRAIYRGRSAARVSADGRVVLRAVGNNEQEKQGRADAMITAYATKLAALESRDSKVTAREQEVQEDLNQARKIRDAGP